ncbi:hypothetical protein GPECTOR_57g475 [Gonium pectorale]|uniref:Uncharacterized protein n=1 Tax=Gonium pectorale TaxID=33097 RepID=A0A150G6M7_GONPE|nr:hypothetical protein GPECTOR_57g475 [Gonium pectorale]|eukprot:KXZ45185.1 hypothetical protein GPECTOR_57g475 [Gonium pectorale]
MTEATQQTSQFANTPGPPTPASGTSVRARNNVSLRPPPFLTQPHKKSQQHPQHPSADELRAPKATRDGSPSPRILEVYAYARDALDPASRAAFRTTCREAREAVDRATDRLRAPSSYCGRSLRGAGTDPRVGAGGGQVGHHHPGLTAFFLPVGEMERALRGIVLDRGCRPATLVLDLQVGWWGLHDAAGLTSLRLTNFNFTADAVTAVAAAAPALTSLNAVRCGLAGLHALLDAHPHLRNHLRNVTLRRCGAWPECLGASLARCHHLTDLTLPLERDIVSGGAIDALHRLTQLRCLDLSPAGPSRRAAEAATAALVQLSGLTQLLAQEAPLVALVPALRHLKGLRALSVGPIACTEAEVAVLTGLTALTWLRLLRIKLPASAPLAAAGGAVGVAAAAGGLGEKYGSAKSLAGPAVGNGLCVPLPPALRELHIEDGAAPAVLAALALPPTLTYLFADVTVPYDEYADEELRLLPAAASALAVAVSRFAERLGPSCSLDVRGPVDVGRLGPPAGCLAGHGLWMSSLGLLHGLRRLGLSGLRLEVADVSALANALPTTLEALQFDDCTLPIAGVGCLAPLRRLRSLELCHADAWSNQEAVSGVMLALLCSLPRLRHLGFVCSLSPASRGALRWLRRELPCLGRDPRVVEEPEDSEAGEEEEGEGGEFGEDEEDGVGRGGAGWGLNTRGGLLAGAGEGDSMEWEALGIEMRNVEGRGVVEEEEEQGGGALGVQSGSAGVAGGAAAVEAEEEEEQTDSGPRADSGNGGRGGGGGGAVGAGGGAAAAAPADAGPGGSEAFRQARAAAAASVAGAVGSDGGYESDSDSSDRPDRLQSSEGSSD